MIASLWSIPIVFEKVDLDNPLLGLISFMEKRVFGDISPFPFLGYILNVIVKESASS